MYRGFPVGYMLFWETGADGAFESQGERDFACIDELAVDPAVGFVGAINQMVAGALTNDFWSITPPNALGTSAAKSPALVA